MASPWLICRTVDLSRDFVGVERIAALATTSSKAAHQLRITLKSGSAPADLNGLKAELNLILPDGISTTADGSIEAGTCMATLPPLCYQRGETRGVLMLMDGTQARIPVYAFCLRCFEDLTDAFTDPNQIVPSLSELLAQLDAIRTVTSSANAAANSANSAAATANTAAGAARTAASGANTAANLANAAAQKINGITASAEALDTGSPASAELEELNGHYNIKLGLPRGKTGATPQISVSVKTGEPGTQAQVAQTGTAENPELEFTLPRGDDGHIGNLTINGKAPDANSSVVLSAADVGAASAESVSALKNDLADAWVSGKTYAVGDYCISGNQLYKCKTAHTAGSAFNADYWDAVSVAGEIGSLKFGNANIYSAQNTNVNSITIDASPVMNDLNSVTFVLLLKDWASSNSFGAIGCFNMYLSYNTGLPGDAYIIADPGNLIASMETSRENATFTVNLQSNFSFVKLIYIY